MSKELVKKIDEILDNHAQGTLDAQEANTSYEALAVTKETDNEAKSALLDLIIDEKLAVLKELKGIDCFNVNYTTDKRPALFVDHKIKELESLKNGDKDDRH